MLLISEVKYQELKDYCLYHGMHYGIIKLDCEDILHDACLHILADNVLPQDYKWAILKYIGKFREKRSRESKREIRYEDMEDTQQI